MKLLSRFLLFNVCLFLFACNGADNNTQRYESTLILDYTEIGINTIISGLDEPWDLAWGPDDQLWYTTLNDGSVNRVNPVNGEKELLLRLPDLYKVRVGMLSMALSRDMNKLPYLFLNYTCLKDSTITSKLVRYTYRHDTLIDPFVLLEIPGNTGHNGSRLAIAPDGKLMWVTGDESCCADGKDIIQEQLAQDSSSLAGKVLRIHIDGSIPPDNPFDKSPIWARGFRVPQGMTYSSTGALYTSEHGDATDDEVNLILKGRNYGYPIVTGYCNSPEEDSFCITNNVAEPLKAWTPTIAPAGMAYYNSVEIPELENSLLLVTLKTQSIRALELNHAGNKIISEKIYFERKFGRLRAICVSPDGDIYFSTSNTDWNTPEGYPKENDDRIIRISKIRSIKNIHKINSDSNSLKPATKSSGSLVYANYCASCHKSSGNGLTAVYPPLKNNKVVTGDKKSLISIVLNGLSGPTKVNGLDYDQSMPSFNFLKDKEVAEVLTYIRSSFGNQADKITPDDVSGLRK